MNKYTDSNKGLVSRIHLEDIAEIFPRNLSRVTLVRLDRCARESGLPTIFALQKDLDEARRAFSCYLDQPSFQRAFLQNFSSDIPALIREADGESGEEADIHDDFLTALSGMRKD